MIYLSGHGKKFGCVFASIISGLNRFANADIDSHGANAIARLCIENGSMTEEFKILNFNNVLTTCGFGNITAGDVIEVSQIADLDNSDCIFAIVHTHGHCELLINSNAVFDPGYQDDVSIDENMLLRKENKTFSFNSLGQFRKITKIRKFYGL